jgi:hypothetical protein
VTAAAKVAAALAKYGRDMALTRLPSTVVTVKGVAQAYAPGEIVGGIAQGDQRVTISDAGIAASAWPGPPRKGDRIVIDGRTWTVQGCESKYLTASILAHVLWCRGG